MDAVKDWCFFLATASCGVAMHAILLQVPGTFWFHAMGLLVWQMVGAAFGISVYIRRGGDQGVMWATGYLLEFVNIVENVFIFHSVAKTFKLPSAHGRKAIFIVMLCQAVYDAIFFMGMADWMRHVRVLPYLVGIWLLWTGFTVLRAQEHESINATNSSMLQFLQGFLGDRFWPGYDEAGHVIVVKAGEVVMSMLGPVLCIMVVMDFFLEVDMTLTKIEEIPQQYVSFTSSVLASFVMPELFNIAESLFRHFFVLKYGIGTIIVFFGVQMLISEFVIVPAMANCAVMVGLVAICIAASACLGTPDEFRTEGAEPEGEPPADASASAAGVAAAAGMPATGEAGSEG